MDKVSACPFLRNISSNFGGVDAGAAFSQPDSAAAQAKGPIFPDESNFEVAFKLFHGEAGVVPLKNTPHGSEALPGSSSGTAPSPASCPVLGSLTSCPFGALQRGDKSAVRQSDTSSDEAATPFSSALAAAPLATIGLSAFGGAGGSFGFDGFREGMEARKEKQRREAEQKRQQEEQQRQQRQESQQSSEAESKPHEALGDDWLATGNCPIARSYRAFNRVVPALAAAFKPPSGVKYICPPAIVALRAAAAKHPFMAALRPQALPIRVLAIGTVGLMLNIPLGAWREHYEKFSPQWILIVHASVPFVAILRKAALMPKYAMAFTIAASIVGQAIGSRAERKRVASALPPAALEEPSPGFTVKQRRAKKRELGTGLRGMGFRQSESMVAYDFSNMDNVSQEGEGATDSPAANCSSGTRTPALGEASSSISAFSAHPSANDGLLAAGPGPVSVVA